MTRRSQFVNVFKLNGVWWSHRRYKRNGEWRNCYAPKCGMDPIFSKDPLDSTQILELVNKRLSKERQP